MRSGNIPEITSGQSQQAVVESWHDKTVETALAMLKSSLSGLSLDEVLNRQELYGPNRLPGLPRRKPLVRFLLQFHNVLIYVLIGAAIITTLLSHLVDTAVILTVVIINAFIGFIQEGKAEKAMDAILHMLAPVASVVRAGKRVSVPGAELVPGDIVLLEAGDKVPADLRLFQVHGLTIQEAILTGESVPVEKTVKPVAADSTLGDRSSMAYSGTLVTSGQGKGIVVSTGSTTEIGRISGLLSGIEELSTPLVNQMENFAKWLTGFILGIAILVLLFGYFIRNLAFDEIFMAVVGLSVAAIPEGLPAVLTITLAIGVQAMARRNAIIRRLPAIETLGSVSVICTDKTGTLTRNEMMVVSAVTDSRIYSVEGTGYQSIGDIKLDGVVIQNSDHQLLTGLARAALLCNDAALHEKDGIWSVEGDPLEGALLAFAGKTGLDEREEHSSWTRTDVIPFDAKHRFMATLNHDHHGHAGIFVKGAPERLLAMCTQLQMENNNTSPLDRSWWEDTATTIADKGQRVLAFAAKTVVPEHTVLEHADLENNLNLLGLVGLIDPPRPEAIAAVAECRTAGIRVKMITGDHAGTAAAIGQQTGLENSTRILTGAGIDAMNDASLAEAVLDTDIFARTSPEHKLRLVMALQSHGLRVAMTGDGVNDAPALKRADAGIAMGRKGSEAAKEASDIVITDDNFASIVAAVREGRTVYDNLKKVITWTLPTSTGEAMTIILALLAGLTLPITPVQILWVNLVTVATLGVALAFEPAEENIMRRLPRRGDESLLSADLAWQIVLVSLLFMAGVFGMYYRSMSNGYSIELARTITVNTLVVMEIFYLFFVRNLHSTSLKPALFAGTPVIWLTVGIVTIAQLAMTCLPFLQKIFLTRNIPVNDGILIIGAGIMMFTIIEIEKQIRLRIQKRKVRKLP